MDPLTDLLTALKNLVVATNEQTAAIRAVFPQSTGTTTSATSGAASALPSPPAGYLTITLPNGQPAKIAYYNS